MSEYILKVKGTLKLNLGNKCIRCGIGIDDDGDGNCAFCAHMTNLEIIIHWFMLMEEECVSR